MTMRNNKSYNEMSKLKTFEERFNYLKLNGTVGTDTFGFDRYMNQKLYKSAEWKKVRHEVIIRDNGCDLGVEGYDINSEPIIIHHINPITPEDIESASFKLFNLNNLVCVRDSTHKALHYGDVSYVKNNKVIERSPNDTCPWR